MIIGIGTDLFDCRRLEALYNRMEDKILHRLFTKEERERCDKRSRRFESYGKIFSAKEATIKAIGETSSFSWQDITVHKKTTGQPYLILLNKIHNDLIKRYCHYKIDLSITDEPPYAQAFVIISQ
jgi:holo-[acyl-carrier protein] synthase